MQSRQGFSSRLGFVLAAAGSAVGLGNIWGFPTQVANHGGGAFLLVYLIVLVVFALPALYAELSIGFQQRANPVTAMQQSSPDFPQVGRTLGFINIVGAVLMLGFYSIIAGWMLAHGVGSLFALLGMPEWAAFVSNNGLARNLIFTALIIFLTATIIVAGVKNGIEKWSKRLMPVLLLLLVGLIVYIFTLPGAMQGLAVFLTPDFKSIADPQLILAAMGQAFFSLSVGVGGMMVYGSYLNRQERLGKLSMSIAGLDTLIAILAGLLIVPALFVAQTYGQTIMSNGELIGRSQLIFEVLPGLFAGLETTGYLIGTFFFTLLAIASITSTIASTEVPVSWLTENKKLSRGASVIAISILVAGISATIILNFELLFRAIIGLLTHFMLPLMGLVYFVFVGWLRKTPDGEHHYEQTGIGRLVHLHMKYLCPPLMLLVFYQVAF